MRRLFRKLVIELALPDGSSQRFGRLGRRVSARIEVRDDNFFGTRHISVVQAIYSRADNLGIHSNVHDLLF